MKLIIILIIKLKNIFSTDAVREMAAERRKCLFPENVDEGEVDMMAFNSYTKVGEISLQPSSNSLLSNFQWLPIIIQSTCYYQLYWKVGYYSVLYCT